MRASWVACIAVGAVAAVSSLGGRYIGNRTLPFDDHPFVHQTTGTGTNEPASVPFPSSPSLLSPQHSTVPPSVTAHALSFPTEIAVASVRRAALVASVDDALRRRRSDIATTRRGSETARWSRET